MPQEKAEKKANGEQLLHYFRSRENRKRARASAREGAENVKNLFSYFRSKYKARSFNEIYPVVP